jgi:hypothetical protein
MTLKTLAATFTKQQENQVVELHNEVKTDHVHPQRPMCTSVFRSPPKHQGFGCCGEEIQIHHRHEIHQCHGRMGVPCMMCAGDGNPSMPRKNGGALDAKQGAPTNKLEGRGQ